MVPFSRVFYRSIGLTKGQKSLGLSVVIGVHQSGLSTSKFPEDGHVEMIPHIIISCYQKFAIKPCVIENVEVHTHFRMTPLAAFSA